eukprot:447968_1
MLFETLFHQIVILIFALQKIGNAFDCTVYNNQADCLSLGFSTCEWSKDNICKCSSNDRLDIFFGIDTSGSIGYENFEIQKEWLETFVTQSIGNNTRIAFDLFSTTSNLIKPLQFWNTDDLSAYVGGIIWQGGWTNTAQLITDALQEFESNGDEGADKKLVI